MHDTCFRFNTTNLSSFASSQWCLATTATAMCTPSSCVSLPSSVNPVGCPPFAPPPPSDRVEILSRNTNASCVCSSDRFPSCRSSSRTCLTQQAMCSYEFTSSYPSSGASASPVFEVYEMSIQYIPMACMLQIAACVLPPSASLCIHSARSALLLPDAFILPV